MLGGYAAQLLERVMVAELRLEARLFDLRHGTMTAGRIPAQKLDLPPGGRAYQAVNERHFTAAVRGIAIDGGSFVDFGAGKGKSLLMASRYPFTSIRGVEYSESLCRIARSNIEKWQRRTGVTTPMTVQQCDAGAYQFGHDERLVFLYNPFGAEVLARVMANLAHSFSVRRRALAVVYHNPQHEEVLRTMPGFHQAKRVHSRVPGRDTVIYSAM